MLVFTNMYKDIGKRMSKLAYGFECCLQAFISSIVYILDGFAYKFVTITISLS